jgi:hypothetical protein
MTEPDKSAEADIEGNIRELMRREGTNPRQVGGYPEGATNNLRPLLGRISANSMRQIDSLISDLQILRDRLQADSSRVEREIVEYEALSQSVIQLTKIIADGVTHLKKVPASVNE